MKERRPKKGGKGRPSKLTETTMLLLNAALSNGMFIEEACIHAGISRGTYYRWLDLGEQHDVEERSSEYRDFFLDIKQALAKSEMRSLTIINEAQESGNWRAAAWLLERRFPEKWGRYRTTELTELESSIDLVELENRVERVERISEILRNIPDPAEEKRERERRAKLTEHAVS